MFVVVVEVEELVQLELVHILEQEVDMFVEVQLEQVHILEQVVDMFVEVQLELEDNLEQEVDMFVVGVLVQLLLVDMFVVVVVD